MRGSKHGVRTRHGRQAEGSGPPDAGFDRGGVSRLFGALIL